MGNKEMKKLLSEVWKSGVANYMRTHQSLYVSKWSWAQRAGVVLGEFQDITPSKSQSLASLSHVGPSLFVDTMNTVAVTSSVVMVPTTTNTIQGPLIPIVGAPSGSLASSSCISPSPFVDAANKAMVITTSGTLSSFTGDSLDNGEDDQGPLGKVPASFIVDRTSDLVLNILNEGFQHLHDEISEICWMVCIVMY